MWHKIFFLSLALSTLASSLEIKNFLSTGNYESRVPRGVYRRNPCSVNSKQFEPNPRGCSWFWECKDNSGNLLTEPREGKCPYDLYFEADPDPACVYPDDLATPCTYDLDNIEAIPNDCVAFQPMKLLPHEFECSSFRLCWRDLTTIGDCPTGLHFSYFDNACVEPFFADCRAVDNYCNSFKTNVTNRDPYSCTTYHVCNECNGRHELIKLNCGFGYEYDDNTNHCATASSVNCTPRTKDAVPGYLPTELTYDCPTLSFSIFPNSEDNHFYFYCVNGRSSLQRCPGNTVFNPTYNECE